MTWIKIKELLFMKARYAMGGGVATGVNYLIYFSLVNKVLSPVWSQVVAYSVSVLVNFFFQKQFVFKLNRSSKTAFGLSLLVSTGGLLLSTSIIYTLNLHTFFLSNQIITKLLTTGVLFFYNFYLKRYVFEKRFI